MQEGKTVVWEALQIAKKGKAKENGEEIPNWMQSSRE